MSIYGVMCLKIENCSRSILQNLLLYSKCHSSFKEFNGIVWKAWYLPEQLGKAYWTGTLSLLGKSIGRLSALVAGDKIMPAGWGSTFTRRDISRRECQNWPHGSAVDHVGEGDTHTDCLKSDTRIRSKDAFWVYGYKKRVSNAGMDWICQH